MGKVISNLQVADQIYCMTVEGEYAGQMGQFYMLRAWSSYPILARPISIHDINAGSISFLYHVVGEGTRKFSELRPGDSIQLEGPFGNGFPQVDGRVALIGGGIGIAPLYLCAKNMPQCDVYLGFSSQSYLTEEFGQVTAGLVHVKVGGTILDEVHFDQYDAIMICGPEPMMKAAQQKQKEYKGDPPVYISIENRMACGIGACLVCSTMCEGGRKKACVDGPVFDAKEVIFS